MSEIVKDYFFCGVGGSGMLPLAMILKARGHRVEGSDRSLDQGRLAAKFAYLKDAGIALYPQDGSGVQRESQILVASNAVEDTVADVVAAKALGLPRVNRPQLLSEHFNAAPLSIGVAGTSGKSTTTAMIAWILHALGRDPTVMNGAVMKNFTADQGAFASALVGSGDVFVSEIDESDGSIALYSPTVAVLNNVALDHKSMDELRALFSDYVARADHAVINLDNVEAAKIAHAMAGEPLTFALDAEARFGVEDISLAPFSGTFTALDRAIGKASAVSLQAPGRHNIANALASLAAVSAIGVDFEEAADALKGFSGIKRRFEKVGEAGGVPVIDDFAHNPDKIAASLSALKAFPGRLIVIFQPHGFGPLKLMRDDFIDVFANQLSADDLLLMPEPVYYGGTVDRSVSSKDIAAGVCAEGRRAEAMATRDDCAVHAVALSQPGDRIIVMGARDDTLTAFAEGIVDALSE